MARKLKEKTVKLLRDAAEAEHAVGDARVGTAIEILLEWYEQSVAEGPVDEHP